ncbi:MAG: hypothetical protein ABI091_20815 [Ferruginibacter sp.]
MTDQEIINAVEETCKSARDNGQSIEIDYNLPFVSIDNNNGESYFFEGQEADELINEARNGKISDLCTIEDIILWQSQGW